METYISVIVGIGVFFTLITFVRYLEKKKNFKKQQRKKREQQVGKWSE